MNLPNKLSLTRVALVPVMVILLHFDSLACRLCAAAVFGAASFTDFLDGHIARKNGLVTDFGKFIDPLADKLLVLCALIMLCDRGLMFSWAVCVILARELAVDGLRMIAVSKGKVIAAGQLGKIKTVSQIILVLWQMIFAIPLINESCIWWSIPGLLFAFWVVAITLWSGIDYFINNGKCLLESK